MGGSGSIGLVLGSAVAPERLVSGARAAETAGFDELWLAEDYFFTGGISGASMALAATDRIRVGLGIVSAVARHPAVLAMEVSTISRVHPGRLVAGVGLGVPAWIRQMGLYPPSPLAAMRECVTGVRRLLEGEEVTEQGRVFSFDRVKLTYPEETPTPIRMGVLGPKMLALSGEIADGSILSVAASHEYVEFARDRIDEGRARAGRRGDHAVTVFAIYSVGRDREAAREAVRRPLAFYKSNGPSTLTDVHGSSGLLADMISRGGMETIAAEMPESWIDELTIAGTPEECAEKIRAYHAVGADSVALFPMPSDRVDEMVRLTADEVLPLL
jgi:alkanesulfonate monooxygenase SsuD/methylene tetrahydromethanopterin reductase-like flavin-dependent oxidoreductase (luciferase family)